MHSKGYNLFIVFQKLFLCQSWKSCPIQYLYLHSKGLYCSLKYKFLLMNPVDQPGPLLLCITHSDVSNTKTKWVASKPFKKAVSVLCYTHSNKPQRMSLGGAACLKELLSLLLLQVLDQPDLWATDHFHLLFMMLVRKDIWPQAIRSRAKFH